MSRFDFRFEDRTLERRFENQIRNLDKIFGEDINFRSPVGMNLAINATRGGNSSVIREALTKYDFINGGGYNFKHQAQILLEISKRYTMYSLTEVQFYQLMKDLDMFTQMLTVLDNKYNVVWYTFFAEG